MGEWLQSNAAHTLGRPLSTPKESWWVSITGDGTERRGENLAVEI